MSKIYNKISLQRKIRKEKRRGRMGVYKLVGFGGEKLKDHLLYNNMNKRQKGLSKEME